MPPHTDRTASHQARPISNVNFLPVAIDQQHRQHSPLFGSADGRRSAVDQQLQRSQNTKAETRVRHRAVSLPIIETSGYIYGYPL